MRTILQVALSVIICSLFLPACGGTTSTDPNERINLVIWSEGATIGSVKAAANSPAAKYGAALVKEFEKQHPNVKVKIEDHGWDEDLRQNLLNALVAGTGPDIVVGENFFKQYASLGTLVPLDDIVDNQKSNLIPGTYASGVYKGHTYALSAFTGVFGLERNCKVVTQAGLDCNKAPATWDEFLQETQAITQKGKGKYYGYTFQGPIGAGLGSVFRLAVLLAQSNASLCKDDCTRPYFNNPQALPVYEYLRKLYKQTPPGLAFNTDEGQIYSQLFKGVSAYQIAGSWHVDWAKQSGCQDCRYSTVPTPSGGREASIIVGNVEYAILKQSKHQAMAKEWIKFTQSDAAQNAVYESIGRLPSTRSALTALRPQVKPSVQSFIDILLNSKELGVLPGWTKNPQKVWDAYNSMVTKILTTDQPIQQLVDEGQSAADQVSQ